MELSNLSRKYGLFYSTKSTNLNKLQTIGNFLMAKKPFKIVTQWRQISSCQFESRSECLKIMNKTYRVYNVQKLVRLCELIESICVQYFLKSKSTIDVIILQCFERIIILRYVLSFINKTTVAEVNSSCMLAVVIKTINPKREAIEIFAYSWFHFLPQPCLAFFLCVQLQIHIG